MASDVEVQDAAAIMADDEEAVQNPKGESGDGEEIHGRDSFPMVVQKGQPALGGLRVLGRSFHPAGNGGFRHVEAEHQEFAMDARRTPNWDCQRPFERSIHGSAWRSCGHHPLVFALCRAWRSEEHTSELQSPCNLVCRL